MDRDAAVEFTKKYLEDVLTFFEINVDVEVVINDDIIEASIPSTEFNWGTPLVISRVVRCERFSPDDSCPPRDSRARPS